MMKNTIYAMDTHFMCENEGPPADEQVEIAKAIGYTGYYVTGSILSPERFHEYWNSANAAGIGLAAAFEGIDVAEPPTPKQLRQAEDVISRLRAPSRVELALKCGGMGENVGNQRCDELALNWLIPIAELLERQGIEGSLYPHFGFYLETLQDALRLQEKVGSNKLKVIFCSYHWYHVHVRVRPQPTIRDLLTMAGKQLNAVNLCGSRPVPEPEKQVWGLHPSIEPLDSGTMDVAEIFRELKASQFSGPIGIQGYGINAPAKEALMRSFRAIQKLI